MLYAQNLPPEYKRRFIINRSSLPSGVPDDYFVDSAFYWTESPEGADFWRAVRNAETEEELPPIPNKQPF